MMKVTSTDQSIILHLSKDEALILFDLIARGDTTSKVLYPEDQAEINVLWNIEAWLEKLLPDVLDENYDIILAEARTRVRET